MTHYDDAPEAAEASLTAAGDAVFRAQDALDDAEARSEAAEREVDAAFDAGDQAAQSEASQRLEAIEQEIVGLQQDVASAEEYANQNIAYWMES